MKKKKYIYTYISLNHFAVHQKLTQHCKSTILQFKKKTRILYTAKLPLKNEG